MKTIGGSTLFRWLLIGMGLVACTSGANEVAPVGGFEIGNGMVVNRVGGYRFKLPPVWEIGQAGPLTQVIAPTTMGTPRPQIQVDVIALDGLKKFTDIDENLSEQPWLQTEIGGLGGFIKVQRTDNGLMRAEIRLRKSESQYFLITIDYGIASNNAAVFVVLNKILESFQRVDRNS